MAVAPCQRALRRAFAGAQHRGRLAALQLGYPWPVSRGSVVAAGDRGL